MSQYLFYYQYLHSTEKFSGSKFAAKASNDLYFRDMAAGEAASRPPYLATDRVSHQHSMAQTRSQHGRAAALLLASSLLILGVVFLAGNSGGAAMLEEEAAQVS